jgi:hypothetical protein
MRQPFGQLPNNPGQGTLGVGGVGGGVGGGDMLNLGVNLQLAGTNVNVNGHRVGGGGGWSTNSFLNALSPGQGGPGGGAFGGGMGGQPVMMNNLLFGGVRKKRGFVCAFVRVYGNLCACVWKPGIWVLSVNSKP